VGGRDDCVLRAGGAARCRRVERVGLCVWSVNLCFVV